MRVVSIVVGLAVVAAIVTLLFDKRPGAASVSLPRLGRYQQEQRWSFRGRAKDPAPTLVIGKIEETPSGAVVHVSVFGVAIANPHNPAGVDHELPHIPLSPAALDASVTELLGTGAPAAEFDAGYSEWLDAEGEAFSVPVSDCLGFVEQTLGSPPVSSVQ